MDVANYENSNHGYLKYDEINENGNKSYGHVIQTSPSINLKMLNASNMPSQENYAKLSYQGPQENEYSQLPANTVVERTKRPVSSIAQEKEVSKLSQEKIEMKQRNNAGKKRIFNRTVKCWVLSVAVLVMIMELAVIIYFATKDNGTSKKDSTPPKDTTTTTTDSTPAKDTTTTTTERDGPNICAKPKSCKPDYGMQIKKGLPGLFCIIDTFENIKSWEKCSALCFATNSCEKWTWKVPNASGDARKCWLYKKGCGRKESSIDYISGEKKCGNLATIPTCAPKYFLAYRGCDMKVITGVGTWERCSQLCSLTHGCLSWTWFHKGLNISPQVCWLKNSTYKEIPTLYGISGEASTYLRCNSPCD